MSYAPITRDELEAWLTRSPFSWSRSGDTAGVYLVHVSNNVAIKLSSTIGSRDDAMGRGQASMNLSLVSRINGRCLNKKARDRKHFKRTLGWTGTWADGLLHWEGVFNQYPGFYDRIATEAPQYNPNMNPRWRGRVAARR
jgi:hypothetical protein